MTIMVFFDSFILSFKFFKSIVFNFTMLKTKGNQRCESDWKEVKSIQDLRALMKMYTKLKHFVINIIF